MEKTSPTSDISLKERFAVIIPVFNHEADIRNVVIKALELKFPVLVVNDGSTDASISNISGIGEIIILHHDANLGKGAALLTGMTEASKIADWAITIDADGQHDPFDALEMMDSIPAGARPIIVGRRTGMTGKDVPWTSRFGRKFSNFWIYLSGGPRMDDSQSGFRIYPLPEAIELGVLARRFQFEVEILVKAHRKNIPIMESPVKVNYKPGAERVSHFRPFVDFLRNSGTFTRLITRRVLFMK